jgi:diguanylate cyclase (GGDEF)-like protein
MNNPFRSLAGRITLLVFAATFVSALTVSLISVQSLDGFLRDRVNQQFPRAANQIAEALDAWYALRARELDVFAGSTILQESVPNLESRGRRGERSRTEAEQYLRYVLESFPQFERLALARPDGEPLIEVGEGEPLPDGLLVSATPKLGTTYISDSIRVGHRVFQVASAPLVNSAGATVARLYASIDLDVLAPLLQSRELGASARVFIVDRDQRLVNPPEGVDPDIVFSTPQPNEMPKDPFVSGVVHYDNIADVRVVGTQMAFSRFGWTLVIEQPFDEAFAPVVRSIGGVAALNLAIVLIVGLVASRIAGSFVKPLRALSEAAQRLSRGERGVEIDETNFSSEEVNLLTRTFNEMSRRLSRNARELEQSHRALEGANDALVAKNDELSNMNLVLEQLSITDGLTKLHNHRYFQESLSRECRRSTRTREPLTLVLIDLDDFKGCNDRFGHAGGDAILRETADILNACVRETDIVTRYGGEEFALLALDTDLEDARILGEKIRAAIESADFEIEPASERAQVTVSIGVAEFHGDEKQLFLDADAALYEAKDAGRNRVVTADPPES